MAADLKVLRSTNLKDISATLRNIADDLEKRDHAGDRPVACVVVVETLEEIDTYFCGEGEAGPNAIMLLNLGLDKMMRDILALKGS